MFFALQTVEGGQGHGEGVDAAARKRAQTDLLEVLVLARFTVPALTLDDHADRDALHVLFLLPVRAANAAADVLGFTDVQGLVVALCDCHDLVTRLDHMAEVVRELDRLDWEWLAHRALLPSVKRLPTFGQYMSCVFAFTLRFTDVDCTNTCHLPAVSGRTRASP